MHLFVEKLRCKICPVRPLDRAGVRVHRKAAEVGLLFQRLKDRSLELLRKIDLTFGPILKPNPDRELVDVTSFDDVLHVYSSGWIGLRSFNALAKFQFSASSVRCKFHHSNTSASARGESFPSIYPSAMR